MLNVETDSQKVKKEMNRIDDTVTPTQNTINKILLYLLILLS